MSLWTTLRQPAPPPVTRLPRWLDRSLGIALALLGFFLPTSVAGVSLMLAVLLGLCLLTGPALWRNAPWRDPVMAIGLLLLAYIALHTLWVSGFSGASLRAINRYHELLMAVILLAVFRLCTRRNLLLWGLLAGTLLYALVHWAALAWPALEAELGPKRISAGFLMALTAYVLLMLAPRLPRPWAVRAAAAFLAVTVVSVVGGRTGHVVLLLLVACAAWQHSPPRWRWLSVLVLPALVAALALGSGPVRERLGETLAGSTPRTDGDLTSTGIRIELMRNGLNLARQHALTGGGFAEYLRLSEASARELYAGDPQRRAYLDRPWVRSANPHNEYLMQLVSGGVLALALFLGWLVAPMLRASVGIGDRTQSALIGVGLAFGVGCLFNSLLLDFVEGHFYVVLVTWLLARASVAVACGTPGGPVSRMAPGASSGSPALVSP